MDSREAERKFSVFHVTQNGETDCFETTHPLEFLDAANVLRSYLRAQSEQSFASTLQGRSNLTDEQFEKYADERMENTGRVTGAFRIDLDNGEMAALNIMDGWQVFSVKDVSTAAYYAMRKTGLSRDRRFQIFIDHLEDRQLINMGKPERFLRGGRALRAEDIQFAESIEPRENLLNFYMETNFDVDAVFGTHVCTDENDDYLNVYANYDLKAQRVCDTLEIVLVGKDRDEAYGYRLNDEEKALVLPKMEAYVRQQWGVSIADCAARYRAENEQAQDEMTMQGGVTLNEKENFEKRLDDLFDALVPPDGQADTVAGEIVRAACRIGYRSFNDGDHIGVGYGRETCNPAARYLMEHAGKEVEKIIANDMWGEPDHRRYDAALTEMNRAVVEYLDRHPELMTEPNDEDMWEYRDNQEDRDIDPYEEEDGYEMEYF